ncbi:MAG: hypothetical protein UZ21_OP11001000929 [Microgenomates bacterium OLB22]|nr:MAG: hypothetical protein UZ21_OP11001000929 [Microgenomates bacterium OLB22]
MVKKIDVTVDTDAAQSHTVAGSYIGLTANDASSTTYGLQVVAEDAGGQVATSGILIENLQATDIDLTTGLLIRATTDGSLPTAIDVSDAEITTALSVGANTISGTTGLIDYTNFDLDASGNITLAGTTGVTFSSTGGIQLAGGVIADSSDGVDINDNLEINGGTVSLTNGTSDLIDWGSDGAGDPTTTSAGWKTKYYGNAYGHGVAGSTLWSVSDDTFKWYDNDTSTYNLKATMGMDTDTYWQIYNDALSEAIRFHTNGTSWFNGGSLVIGANATSAKFQVVGDESRFGTAGTITIATGDGDVYVQDALEVDGDLHLVAGADLIFGGTTTLAETTAANDSGAYIVGTFDEFDNSSSSNVQDVLDDLDAGLTTALANGGLWTDSTTTAYLTTTTDEVVIGGTSPLSSAKLSIDGDADQIQFIVQGNATQTANLATFENSSGTDLLTIDASGVLSVPYLIDISNSAYGIDPSGTSNFGGYSLKVTGGALLGFDSGNVGIGPAAQTADELLHVGEATDGDSIALLLENSQAAGAASTNETSQLRFGFGGNNDVARILAGKVNDYTSGANEDSFLSFYTDVNGTATEQLKIDEAGLATFTGDIAVNGDDITSDGTLTIDAATDINLDADGADIVLKDGGTTFATFTNSTTDLTLDIVGSQLILADTDVLNIGGVTGLAYNAISDSGTTSHSLASDDDLYVEGDVEVDGTIWADGAVTSAGTITGADFACTDCLDFAELEDTLDLDASLTLNQSTNTWTQNYAGTTGTGITYNVDSLTSGVALALASTSTAITTNSNLLTLDWSPGSLTTAAIDLFEISTTTNGNVTGSYLNFLDNSVSIFKVEQSGNVTTAGDIAVNGDDITADGALSVNSASYVRIGDSGTPGSASGDDDLYVEGDLEVDAATYLDGDLTIGNAGTDNVTVNSKTWTFANDTDFALSGGTNGLSFDTDTFSVDATNNRIGIGTTAPSEKLHVAGNVLVDAQSDATAHNFASGCNCSMNSAAGTFGSETSRDSVTDSVVYKGKLFVAVKETDLAGIYRWDGGTTWQLVTNTPGKVNSGDTANIDSFTMTVLNDKLVIGTQGTGTEAAIFYSTDADTGSTPTWTQVNTTKGSFGMSRTGISSVGDLAVLNNVLYMTNLGNNTMEFGRWNGSTGAAVFTQINATDGALAAETADIDNAVLAVYNNMVMIGAITSSTTARIGAYQPNTTGAATSIVIINATSGAFGNLVNSPDITQMEVYNGQLFAVIQRTNAASVVRWTGVSPVQVYQRTSFFVTNTAGTLDSGDTANIDNIVLEQYNGKLYAASQTGSATNTGAVYEFDGYNTWTLVNTTRGTFDGTTNVDNVTNMIAYDGTMYVGTDDLTNGVGAVYSWSKTASNSYGLKFKGGNNYGSISFVDKHNVNDATQQSGSFLLSHSIQLDSAGFDLAEDYPTYDTTLKSKEIVSLDPQKDTFIKTCAA